MGCLVKQKDMTRRHSLGLSSPVRMWTYSCETDLIAGILWLPGLPSAHRFGLWDLDAIWEPIPCDQYVFYQHLLNIGLCAGLRGGQDGKDKAPTLKAVLHQGGSILRWRPGYKRALRREAEKSSEVAEAEAICRSPGPADQRASWLGL